MKTKEVLEKLLSPVNREDQQQWDEFLGNLNEQVLWLPNARRKFKYLRGYIYEESLQEHFPSVFIYTHHAPSKLLFDLLEKGEHVLEDFRIRVDRELDLSANWDYRPEYGYLDGSDRRILACFRNDEEYMGAPGLHGNAMDDILPPKSAEEIAGLTQSDWYASLAEKIKLLRLTVGFPDMDMDTEEEVIKTLELNVLYLFMESMAFFKKFVVEEGLRISQLVTRCSDPLPFLPERYFEPFMGFMGVEFLISTLDAVPMENYQVLQNDSDLEQVFEHPDNRRYLLQKIRSLEVPEDIYKVHYLT
jgi:hypothetical protein